MMQIRIMRSAGVMSRMQWRGGAPLSRCGCVLGGELARQSIPFFRIFGYDAGQGNRERNRITLAAGVFGENGEMKSQSSL